MTAAIMNGLIDKNVSPSNVSGNCPTGNCTWEIYQSMGVCSNVADVSSTITSHCRDSTTQLDSGGCNYSVPTIDRYPTVQGTNLTNADTLWIGAINVPYDWVWFPGLNTLVQFFIIYAPDVGTWVTNDPTTDHTSELVALEVNLTLCLHTYNTTMTFGVTTTNLVSQSTNLNWQSSQQANGTISFSAVTTTQDSEVFWMDSWNVLGFNAHLSLQTFTGSAYMLAEDFDPSGNTFKTDTAHAIASSLYGNPSGKQGLSNLLDNLTMSMTNA